MTSLVSLDEAYPYLNMFQLSTYENRIVQSILRGYFKNSRDYLLKLSQYKKVFLTHKIHKTFPYVTFPDVQ